MFRGLLLALVIASSTLAAGINSRVEFKTVHEALITKITALAPVEVVSKQPPAPRVETPPAQPNPQMIWIPGYWAWERENADFAWVCGIWRLPPTDHQWVAGYWKQDNGWYWVGGYWQLSGSQPIIAAVAPPSIPEENVGNPPNNNSFWAPGYWNYNAAAKNYNWLGGSWQAFDTKIVFTPAHWQWRPEGYLFVSSFWDWSLEARGVAYDCEAKGGLVPLTAEVIITRLYYCYPDYNLFFWHHWHCCPDFWVDCWCLPPWWGWSGWWTFSWNNNWWLWWWWGHPGFPLPHWLLHDVVVILPPPSPDFIRFIEGAPMPISITDDGVPSLEDWLDAIKDITGNRTPLVPSDQLDEAGDATGKDIPDTDSSVRPGGTTTPDNVTKPNTGDTVNPSGVAPIPPLPSAPGSIAPIPPRPQTTPPSTYTPPTPPQNPPNYQPPVYNPPIYQPPVYNPPDILIIPPRWDDDDHRRPPHREPPQTRPPKKPDYNPPSSQTPNSPNYIPPSTTSPNRTPPATRSPNYNPPTRSRTESPNNQSQGNIPRNSGFRNNPNLRSNPQMSPNRQQQLQNNRQTNTQQNKK